MRRIEQFLIHCRRLDEIFRFRRGIEGLLRGLKQFRLPRLDASHASGEKYERKEEYYQHGIPRRKRPD